MNVLLEALKNAHKECEAELAAILNSSDEEEIQKELRAYEEKLRASYSELKDEKIHEKELEIKALDNLIEREEQKEAVAVNSAVSEAVENAEGETTADNSYYPG